MTEQFSFADASRTAVRRLLSDRVSVTLGVVFAIVAAGIMLRSPERGDWFGCFVQAAERMQVGETIHRHETKAYAYPPAMAMLSVPLANLPYRPSLVGFYAVNMLAAWVAFVAAWRLAGGSPLMQLAPRCRMVLLLTVMLAGRYFIAPLQNLQFDMIIAALILGGALAMLKGRQWSGAVCIGLAAGMKCTPLLFAPYLIWRRRFTAAVVVVAVAVGINLVPDLLWPQTNGHSYVADWNSQFLSSVATRAPGDWYSAMQMNQSVAGALNRWYAVLQNPQRDAAQSADLVGHAATLLRMTTYGACLAMLAVTLWVARRRATRPCESNETARAQFAAEIGAVCALMLLLSPMSSKAHYVILLLPSLLLVRAAVERPTAGNVAWLVALAVTGLLTSKGFVGRTAGDWALVIGMPTFYAATCWVGMLSIIARCSYTTAAAGTAAETPHRLAQAA
ncbi:MAG: glycosyltransferase family 87 protein [Pirellulales bacterium]